MLADFLSAGGVVMLPLVLASVGAWWLALSSGARARRIWLDLEAARKWLEISPTGFRTEMAAGGGIELASGELARLGQRLRLLAVLVGILPLLGLLGTVSGMIGTFDVIQANGMGEPRLLAGGIREALIATQTGLATAIPALLFHQAIASRLRRAETEEDLLVRRLAVHVPQGSRFGEIAVGLGFAGQGDLDRCLALARERSVRVGEALVAEGRLSPLQRRIVLALQGRRHD